ncbi:MAG TPA: CARDB domain-containing protein [Candidatus Thermoplasmatota archaeon]|nr:CARDB domain-containing protein [Candidatus Thermoplasmatota archaeon]
MNQRALAFTFAMLMLVSGIPSASASHTGAILPADVDVPVLPHVKPSQSCAQLGIGADILAFVNDPADPAFFENDVGAPAVCVNDQPIEQYQTAIVQMDLILEDLRNASREVQRQVDERTEATLPDSDYPADLVEPRTVLLDDTFDGSRFTGFGDWKVVTERGEDAAWRLAETQTPNGTRHTYRFGDEEGYERGAHQWLVSPELDLTSLKQNKTAVQDLLVIRQRAHDELDTLCNRGAQPVQPIFLCQRGNPQAQPAAMALVDAYEAAFDAAIDQLPVMQQGAFLDLTYRMNLAPTEDGVRMWVFAGDRQPDRTMLFDPDFAQLSNGYACAHEQARPVLTKTAYEAVNGTLLPGSNDAGNATCTPSLDGGSVVVLPGMVQTKAFKTGTPDSRIQSTVAFTGNTTDFVTQRLNLTPYMDERIWVLFEVKTLPNDRGVDIFTDEGRFKHHEHYGFELAKVHAEGDGYHRNVRLKDVGATFPYVVEGNAFDDGRTVRTTLPSGNQSIAAYLHNAGDFTENATFTLNVFNAANNQLLGTYGQTVTLIPDEVRTLVIPWSKALKGGVSLQEGTLYRLTGHLDVYDMNDTRLGDQLGVPEESPTAIDPNNTRVRPANAADPRLAQLGAGTLDVSQLLRVATVRTLTPVRADGERGLAIQVCSSVSGLHCEEQYAARKGETRIVLVGIRNDGNAPQDVTADLVVTLGGIVKDDLVSDGPSRLLRDMQPGETRIVQWTVTPSEPGAYTLQLGLPPGTSVGNGPAAERRMFVQRSTGLICLDTIVERECGPTYEGGLVPALRGEDVTAATMGADGTLYVATEVREAQEGVHSGQLAARDPTTGAWSVLANLSASVLNDTFAEGPETERAWGSIRAIAPASDGSFWLAGDNRTLLHLRSTGILAHVTVPADDHTDLTAALWHGDHLVVGGANGTLANVVGEEATRFTVRNAFATTDAEGDAAVGHTDYHGVVTDLLHAQNGDAVLLGEDGIVLRNAPGTTAWADAFVGEQPVAIAIHNRTLRDGTLRDGHLILVGDDVILEGIGGAAASFRTLATPVARPPLALPAPDALEAYVSAYTEDTGALVLIDQEGRLATCRACDAYERDWSYPELALPPVFGVSAVHPAKVLLGVGGSDASFLLGQGGLVLQRAYRGGYPNDEGWTTVAPLAAHDGGILQTVASTAISAASESVAFMAKPVGAGRDAANDSTEFRLFFNQSIRNASAFAPVDVRLVYLHVPVVPAVASQNVNQSGAACRPASQSPDLGVSTVCNAERVRHTVASFAAPTNLSGWDARFYDGLPPASSATLGVATPGPTTFAGLEFFVSKNARYALDDFHLMGLVAGKWVDVLEWRGPDPAYHAADVFTVDAGTFLEHDVSAAASAGDAAIDIARDQTRRWEMWPGPAFDAASVSPWHVTEQYADRPVFAANNEMYRTPALSSPTAPRLMNNLDSRLVSPIIDLRDAYDPAVSFRHSYAFRTLLDKSSPFNVHLGDGGVVEIQYLLQGQDCGSSLQATTCGWSPFYPVVPDQGYPQKTDLGFVGLATGSPNAGDTGLIAENRSYWGRMALPDEEGVISGPRRTDTYDEEQITFANVSCTTTQLNDILTKGKSIPCVPTNLSGRQVRVSFHLVTAGDRGHVAPPVGVLASAGTYNDDPPSWNASVDPEASRLSFPGEGWYITDFKVLGARKLGIDLEANNMTFRVGYDVGTIGVGPGTRVPVNVTVLNNGTFDALGYGGRLRVSQVVDRALGISVPVETITLSQQPLLEAGKSANHTLAWNVPAQEGAQYVLEFTVDPIGIDRDEDWLDNAAHIGTAAIPVPAQTVRRFDTEFLVSPENATIDITRYIPMFINNTGNVPVSGIHVERRISMIGRDAGADAPTCAHWRDLVASGRPSAIVDCREWTTARAAPAGARTALTAISDDVSPTADLFWKAPERANYLVSVSAQTDTLQSGLDRRVSAFATYLFDDVEGGVRGEAQRGAWVFGPGWNATQPGFRSTDSYAFGEPLVGRYPASANASLVSPTVDLGSARTASVAFFHKYRFEDGFDGGMLEASADGGQTWKRLTPMPDSETTAGYNASFPVQASSPLHPDRDPDTPGVYAFTSNSSRHPASVDGWVLSQFDLTGLDDITEDAVEYEAYGALELGNYAKADKQRGNAHYSESWCPGTIDADRCWLVENLSEGTRVGPGKPAPGEEKNTILWSGSTSLDDDGKRPIQNHLLEFEVDVSTVTTDQVVTADWWEYASRFNKRVVSMSRAGFGDIPGHVWPDELETAYTFASGNEIPQTYRFNLGNPEIVETRGKWYHMHADLTKEVATMRAKGHDRITMGFAYTPIAKYPSSWPADLDVAMRSRDSAIGGEYTGAGFYHDDPGFAIDALDIRATRIVRGQPLGQPTILMDETRAWSEKHVSECGTGGTPEPNYWQGATLNALGCMTSNTVFNRADPLIPAETVGRNWALVTELPSVEGGWGVVPVKDGAGHAPGVKLKTGEEPKAWWSGELPLNANSTGEAIYHKCGALNATDVFFANSVACPVPGSESRLVTPAFDLGAIAGTDARLSFGHRFAFGSLSVLGSTPLASGGVVEIQTYDSQTKTWGPWKQIYASQGGYNAVTANYSKRSAGVFRYDPPFETLVSSTGERYQALYSGSSNGWRDASYDVSEYIGKKVRVGFHIAWSEDFVNRPPLRYPDANGDGLAHGGWWITDVAIVGKVIVGEPVQLRWRAGTDANVDEGAWQFDDIGVYGSRYRRNVGLFVDETPHAFGAMPDSVVKIPVTLRNLGEDVQTNLSVRVITMDDTPLTFEAPQAPSARALAPDRFQIEGITLGPGQSKTIDLYVHTPRTFSSIDPTTTLHFEVKRYSVNSQDFLTITDNDVQGLLTRDVVFRLQTLPEVVATTTVVRDPTPTLGEPVDLEASYRNDGYAPATLSLACKAQTVTGYLPANHNLGGDTDTPIVAASYPCPLVSGATILAPKETTTLVFRVTPSANGFLRFALNGSATSGKASLNFTDRSTGVQVGVTPVVWSQTFDENRAFTENFSRSPNTKFQYLRGHDAPGSIVVGIDDNDTQINGNTYAFVCSDTDSCRAVTEPIDLHNFSASNPAFLSFYHMDRLARYDGARVVARKLLNENQPGSFSSWSPPCVLVPTGGYEGIIRQIPVQAAQGQGPQAQTPPSDPNPLFSFNPPQNRTVNESYPEFFITKDGRWEESWSLASFDLAQSCVQTTNRAKSFSLVGNTVRFEIEVFAGPFTVGPLSRGLGQGILIDDMSVSPVALSVRPMSVQRATLLDNTTKTFHVVVENRGSVADTERLEYDALNSSAPQGSVAVDSDAFVLVPGERRIVDGTITLPRDPSLLPTDFKVRLAARSLTDRNAGGLSTIDIAFAPREWAELAVQAEAPTALVQEGTEAFIPITIQNLGVVESKSVLVRIVDTWPGGSIVADRDLDPLPPYALDPDGSSRILDFAWHPETGSLGMHTLTITVDPDGHYQEYTRSNNVVTLHVPVSDLLIPDLHVANVSALSLRNAAGGVVSPAIDADVARYEVTAGELVSFELKVANNGRAGATNVDVRAFIGALSLPPKTIPYIAPGSEAIVTFNWLAQKGEHEIEFLVRSEQVELSTANNRYPGTGVTLLTVKGYEIDIQIPDVTAILEPGTTIEVPFSIRNAGNAGEDLLLVAHAPEGTHLALPREGFFLRAGETYSDKARLVLAAEAVAGEQFMSIDAVARENPMKVASGRGAMRVNASYGGSIAGGLGVGAPPGFVLPVELVNEGNSLEPWSVFVRLPAGWSADEAMPANVSVPAHGKTTLDLHLHVPPTTSPGERVLAVKATLPNGDKRDGLARTSVLPMRAAGVSVTDAVPKADHGALTMPIVVENKGNVQQPFEVLLVDAPAGIELRVSPSSFDLPPGGKAVAQLIVKPNASVEAGTYAIAGYTFFEGVSPQTQEGRANVQSLKVPIVRQDLRLAPLEFSPRAGLETGDRVTVKVSVANRGLSEVKDVPVHLFVDDVFVDEVTVPAIASGSRSDVTFNWTALAGAHTLTAVVDPYSDTVESDRADNAVSALATVGSDIAPGGVAAGRAKTPAPDLSAILAVALVACALVTLRNGSRRQRR